MMDRQHAVRLIGMLEDEINNGGFHQFFYNSAGDDTAEIIQALETIGALKTAAIVKSAAGKFPGGMPPQDRFARQDLLLDTVAPKGDEFNTLDQEFYTHPDDLSNLQPRFTA
jgi:hypothetical protein